MPVGGGGECRGANPSVLISDYNSNSMHSLGLHGISAIYSTCSTFKLKLATFVRLALGCPVLLLTVHAHAHTIT